MQKQSEQERLAQHWTESQSVVASYIYSLVPNFHQTEDILQQVAVTLVREYSKYDPSRPFLPWALGIARNLALKARKESGQQLTHLLDENLITQVQAVFEQEADNWAPFRQALQECLRKQQGKAAEALHWRYAHDLKPQDVAHRMNLSSGATRVVLHRARAVLRRCIERRMRGTT